MSYEIQTFLWSSGDSAQDWRDLTGDLEVAQVDKTDPEERGPPDLAVSLEFSDDKTADAWGRGAEVPVEFTLSEHEGTVEGTAEIIGLKTSLDRKAHHRICGLRLEAGNTNYGSEDYPDVLG